MSSLTSQQVHNRPFTGEGDREAVEGADAGHRHRQIAPNHLSSPHCGAGSDSVAAMQNLGRSEAKPWILLAGGLFMHNEKINSASLLQEPCDATHEISRALRLCNFLLRAASEATSVFAV